MGRFAEGKGNLERLTLPFSEAAQGRNVTVGGNFEYFLFRPESGEKQVKRVSARLVFHSPVLRLISQEARKYLR